MRKYGSLADDPLQRAMGLTLHGRVHLSGPGSCQLAGRTAPGLSPAQVDLCRFPHTCSDSSGPSECAQAFLVLPIPLLHPPPSGLSG